MQAEGNNCLPYRGNKKLHQPLSETKEEIFERERAFNRGPPPWGNLLLPELHCTFSPAGKEGVRKRGGILMAFASELRGAMRTRLPDGTQVFVNLQ